MDDRERAASIDDLAETLRLRLLEDAYTGRAGTAADPLQQAQALVDREAAALSTHSSHHSWMGLRNRA